MTIPIMRHNLKEELIMDDVLNQLIEDWEEAKEKLKELEKGNNKDLIRLQYERVNNLENRIVDLKKATIDADIRNDTITDEYRFKSDQMERDEKNQKKRNWIEIAKIAVPVIGAFTMGLISMKWEKIDTLTSTAGKSSLRDILRFR